MTSFENLLTVVLFEKNLHIACRETQSIVLTKQLVLQLAMKKKNVYKRIRPVCDRVIKIQCNRYKPIRRLHRTPTRRDLICDASFSFYSLFIVFYLAPKADQFISIIQPRIKCHVKVPKRSNPDLMKRGYVT